MPAIEASNEEESTSKAVRLYRNARLPYSIDIVPTFLDASWKDPLLNDYLLQGKLERSSLHKHLGSGIYEEQLIHPQLQGYKLPDVNEAMLKSLMDATYAAYQAYSILKSAPPLSVNLNKIFSGLCIMKSRYPMEKITL